MEIKLRQCIFYINHSLDTWFKNAISHFTQFCPLHCVPCCLEAINADATTWGACMLKPGTTRLEEKLPGFPCLWNAKDWLINGAQQLLHLPCLCCRDSWRLGQGVLTGPSPTLHTEQCGEAKLLTSQRPESSKGDQGAKDWICPSVPCSWGLLILTTSQNSGIFWAPSLLHLERVEDILPFSNAPSPSQSFDLADQLHTVSLAFTKQTASYMDVCLKRRIQVTCNSKEHTYICMYWCTHIHICAYMYENIYRYIYWCTHTYMPLWQVNYLKWCHSNLLLSSRILF